jgi:predicted 2-oxoglutarate/Fe(II)-dependent dioxygenase YbiX
MKNQIAVRDVVPWFNASTLAGTSHDFCVMAGRWVALCFVHDLSDAVVVRTLADIIATLGRFFNDDHVIFYAVLTAPPVVGTEYFVQASHRGLGFMKDYDSSLTRLYGTADVARLVVIDPLMRAERIFALGANGASSEDICTYLAHLPPAGEFSGVALPAPVLVIPNVFEPEFCEQLVHLHETQGAKATGFMRDEQGKTRVVVDREYKSRTDCILEDNFEVCASIRDRVVQRVVPMMERFLQYRPTRMERYMVSCYDTETGGHFSRHRDNANKGAEHRRFAASFNLNQDYDGCGLMCAEFGRTIYKAPFGGCVIFSTAILHEVMPITRGKRYAFIPFFYGEEDAQVRLKNNANMGAGEKLYTGEGDRLFPDEV